MKKIKAAVAIAGVLAGVGLTAAPAEADPANCGSKVWGGQYICGGAYGNGLSVVVLPDGSQEVFVVGTDHALWHEWTMGPGGSLSGWFSLGGYLTSPVGIANNDGNGAFTVTSTGPMHMGGGGYQPQARDRHANGSWSDWYNYS